MDENTRKAAEISKAITKKGKRALWVPVKNGIKVFEVDQKEVKIPYDKVTEKLSFSEKV